MNFSTPVILFLSLLLSASAFAGKIVKEQCFLYAGDVSTLGDCAQERIAHRIFKECGTLTDVTIKRVKILVHSTRPNIPNQDDHITITGTDVQSPFNDAKLFFGWYPQATITADVTCPGQ